VRGWRYHWDNHGLQCLQDGLCQRLGLPIQPHPADQAHRKIMCPKCSYLSELTSFQPFSYGAGEAGAGGFETAVFSHAAGWGYDEAYGGAPFDAAHNLRGAMTGFNHGVHDPSYGHKSNKVNGNNPNVTTRRDGTTRDVITTHEHPDANEKTDTLGHDTNTVHSRPNNVNTGSAGVVNNRNLEPAAAPTTPTRDGRFHQSNKSLGRRPVGGYLGGQGVDHMV
jgi:hypothetical protein